MKRRACSSSRKFKRIRDPPSTRRLKLLQQMRTTFQSQGRLKEAKMITKFIIKRKQLVPKWKMLERREETGRGKYNSYKHTHQANSVESLETVEFKIALKKNSLEQKVDEIINGRMHVSDFWSEGIYKKMNYSSQLKEIDRLKTLKNKINGGRFKKLNDKMKAEKIQEEKLMEIQSLFDVEEGEKYIQGLSGKLSVDRNSLNDGKGSLKKSLEKFRKTFFFEKKERIRSRRKIGARRTVNGSFRGKKSSDMRFNQTHQVFGNFSSRSRNKKQKSDVRRSKDELITIKDLTQKKMNFLKNQKKKFQHHENQMKNSGKKKLEIEKKSGSKKQKKLEFLDLFKLQNTLKNSKRKLKYDRLRARLEGRDFSMKIKDYKIKYGKRVDPQVKKILDKFNQEQSNEGLDNYLLQEIYKMKHSRIEEIASKGRFHLSSLT